MNTEITPLGLDIFKYVMDFYKATDILVGGDLNKCSEVRSRYGRLSQIVPENEQEMSTVKVAVEYFEGLLENKLSFLTESSKSLPPFCHLQGHSDFEFRVLDRDYATVHQEVQDLCTYLDDYQVYTQLVEGSPRVDEYVLSFAKDTISQLPFCMQLGINVARPLYFGKWGKELAPVME